MLISRENKNPLPPLIFSPSRKSQAAACNLRWRTTIAAAARISTVKEPRHAPPLQAARRRSLLSSPALRYPQPAQWSPRRHPCPVS
uniref:Uncharacterized protein n=1 Tax=Arundo donax TaxID=35708 RepID=A0A0A9CG39_ARUDO